MWSRQMPQGGRKVRRSLWDQALEMTYLSQRKEPVFRMLFFFLMINIMQDLYKMNSEKRNK